MLFSSIPFLFTFLPCVIVLYFVVPKKARNTVLLIASLFFYGWGEPKFLVFMLVSIIQGYIFGRLIEKYRDSKLSKLFLIITVAFSLALLCYCKYTDFFLANFNKLFGLSVPLLKIALPIGISFYTFQILSYSVDVYRGDTEAQRSIIDFALFVSMFPQLIAGPIVRYVDVAAQLKERTHSLEKAALGVRRFVIGIGKKILVANVLGELVAVFKTSSEKSVLFFWIYAISYTLHIYFDFSGYSDMAIGLGKIFGFDFVENFNFPYISTSITEFWRRWHMSLGTWFRDYVYIPLGGNRNGKGRQILNILIVWVLTGFWHGAEWTFAAWGLLFAILLTIEKLWLLKRLEKIGFLRRIYVLLFVILSFVIFDSANLNTAFETIGAMFGAGEFSLVSAESLYYLKSYGPFIIAAAIGATPIFKNLFGINANKPKLRKITNIIEPVFIVAILIASTAFLVDGSFNPFLYFRF